MNPTLSGSSGLNAGSIGGNNTFGLFSVTGPNASTLQGTVNNTGYEQINVTGSTLHLNGVTFTNSWATNAPPLFVIGAGGTVDNTSGNSSLTGHMAVVLSGGSLTNSAGNTSFSTAGQIYGYGTVSGPIAINGGATASGGTLTLDGTQGTGITVGTGWGTGGGANDILDLKGKVTYTTTGFLNPNGATVQIDGATLTTSSSSGMIYTGAGKLNVASGTNTLNGALIPNGSNGSVADVTVQSWATLTLQNANSNYTAVNAHNVTLANGSVLHIGTGNNALTLTGNFSSQQTDTVNGFSYKGTAGLGPDLIMNGGSSPNPESKATAQTLEVMSVNKGYNAAAFIDNFALSSLTIGPYAYVELVDNDANATLTGWTSGSEALYLDGLFDGVGSATLDLNGIYAYLSGYGQLQNGLYTDADGDKIMIVGAPVPEPSGLALMGVGLITLATIARRTRHQSGPAMG